MERLLRWNHVRVPVHIVGGSRSDQPHAAPVAMRGRGSEIRDQGSAGHRIAGPILILLSAFLAIVPQLVRGNSCGHDFDFHLVSWLCGPCAPARWLVLSP